jgi:putative N-acetylmannosamine-6-phosphate epimerase
LGHPTKLGGTPADVAADCRRFEEQGAAGVDLLAYRAFEADPIELTRAARKALRGELICAGSVDTPERIRALADAGADAFTVGSAVFSGSFSPRRGSMLSQLADILAASQ